MEDAFRGLCRRYGYQEIRTPIFEETALFSRSIGEETDIVSKEMYTFTDRGERSLTLRPEGTAPVVRAYLEHNLGAQRSLVKLCYLAPIFRYERPQKGRFRQAHQVGVEALGAPGPDIDAETIALAWDLLEELGIEGASLEINSVGCPECRPAYRQALLGFLKPKIGQFCPTCQQRYQTNPLRIWDCKAPQDQQLMAGAPVMLHHLGPECRGHFGGLQAQLQALEIPFAVNSRIVRGLDYYTRTAFEITHPGLGAQNAILGGGRYDGLVEELGGPPTPAVGWAAGIERMLMALESQGEQEGAEPLEEGKDTMAYLAEVAPYLSTTSAVLLRRIRQAGISTQVGGTGRSLKAQMKEANRLRARFTLIRAERELSDGTVMVRDMLTGDQQEISIKGGESGQVFEEAVLDWMKQRLGR